MNYDQAVKSATEQGTEFIGQAIAKIIPSEYGGSFADNGQIQILEKWIAIEKATKVNLCAFEYADDEEGTVWLEMFEAGTLRFCKEYEDGGCTTYYLPSVLVF